ncbi:putative KIN17-like protein [Helianthus annuus]|nr:putative KIN17-like protein [Helianthus annuus]
MGKNEFLTPKAIANRIKAKGLQKLRWYCQMCQKQCRDENGFKCHCMSESHQRQMEVFGQNPHRIVDGYSEEFESTFLDHMKRSHRFSRIAATVVYNEYINDRHHVHMNSTKWATLTEFVKYLGKTGKCKVDETPKGWFITYIDRDSETIFKERLKNKRAKADIVDEEKQEREIKRQIERAEQLGWGMSVIRVSRVRIRSCCCCERMTVVRRRLNLVSVRLKTRVKKKARVARYSFSTRWIM